MSLSKLIDCFAHVSELPIEIPEVRDAIVKLNYQDDITFVPKPIDPTKLRGVIAQYTWRSVPYGEPQLCTVIVYSELLPLDWQRVVCGKELIHVMDARVEHTRSADEINNLIVKLLGPLSTEDFGFADLIAAKDKFALYQALPVLFPDVAREKALAKLTAQEKTMQEIAAWASLPLPLTELVMSDAWPSLKQDVCSF